MKLIKNNSYLLLIEEAEIKEGNIAIHNFGMGYDLEIPCDKDNLKSNTRKLVVAYYPLTKETKELDLPLLPSFEIDVVDLAEVNSEKHYYAFAHQSTMYQLGFVEGYKAAQSDKQFSLEDMKKAMFEVYKNGIRSPKEGKESFSEISNRVIQSLSAQHQQLPISFEPEYEYDHDDSVPFPKTKTRVATIKTITNSEGKEELVGNYKY